MTRIERGTNTLGVCLRLSKDPGRQTMLRHDRAVSNQPGVSERHVTDGLMKAPIPGPAGH